MPEEQRDFVLSRHAIDECARRNIPVDLVHRVLQAPDRTVAGRGSKRVYQGRVTMGNREFLLRVVVAPDVDPNLVVTAYRTSKIEKYEQLP